MPEGSPPMTRGSTGPWHSVARSGDGHRGHQLGQRLAAPSVSYSFLTCVQTPLVSVVSDHTLPGADTRPEEERSSDAGAGSRGWVQGLGTTRGFTSPWVRMTYETVYSHSACITPED
ncbi:hypothetical protein NDU88_006399 [Pleurodeles waltl]|uniref:Uncharacterized protein n=1 Tax=Pleurodeles waltl TaxID=8319 RepID=A0AAV7L400_PLEWA|nr:hypothetical protein NDU88_006399 [Pleurodeles waltl]